MPTDDVNKIYDVFIAIRYEIDGLSEDNKYFIADDVREAVNAMPHKQASSSHEVIVEPGGIRKLTDPICFHSSGESCKSSGAPYNTHPPPASVFVTLPSK